MLTYWFYFYKLQSVGYIFFCICSGNRGNGQGGFHGQGFPRGLLRLRGLRHAVDGRAG